VITLADTGKKGSIPAESGPEAIDLDDTKRCACMPIHRMGLKYAGKVARIMIHGALCRAMETSIERLEVILGSLRAGRASPGATQSSRPC
jgi:hypothetical protein